MNKEQIAALQRAMFHLDAARDYLNEASDGVVDPSAREISKIIAQLETDVIELDTEG